MNGTGPMMPMLTNNTYANLEPNGGVSVASKPPLPPVPDDRYLNPPNQSPPGSRHRFTDYNKILNSPKYVKSDNS